MPRPTTVHIPAPPPPLLHLPPELRIIIHADVISDIHIQVTERPAENAVYQCLSRDGNRGTFDAAHFQLYIALTRTCRQIYGDTRLLPFVYNPQVWREKKTFVRWFVSLREPVRDAVWVALDDAQRAAVRNTKEYKTMLAVERFNDLVLAVEVWGEARAPDLFDY